MDRLTVVVVTTLALLAAGGCSGPGGHAPGSLSRSSSPDGSPGRSHGGLRVGGVAAGGRSGSGGPVALLNGEPVTRDDLWPALVESVGGYVLAERVLDQMIIRRLTDLGMTVQADQLQTERRLLGQTLDRKDPDRAERLLRQLRERRGLGENRFEELLRRNAGLRLLIQGEVEISDAAVQQAYRYEHGPRYETRLIVTDTFVAANELVRRLRAGASFVDLAIAHSVDPSRSTGGRLDPFSVVDPTYPKAIRVAAQRLKPGQVSDPIALEEGFALLRLERLIEGDGVELATVEASLRQRVRRRVERMLMERLVRTLLGEASVIVLDPSLDRSWRQHRRRTDQDTQ